MNHFYKYLNLNLNSSFFSLPLVLFQTLLLNSLFSNFLFSFLPDKTFKIMDDILIVPDYKYCTSCKKVLFLPQFLDEDYYFYCKDCSLWINWKEMTLLARKKLKYSEVRTLLTLFIQNKSPTQAYNILRNFYNDTLNKNTIYNYFKLFGEIAFSYYKSKLHSTILTGEIEVDETVVFKAKKTRARRYRRYQLQSMWLLGMIERKSKEFIIIPINSRNEFCLIMKMLKFIDCNSTIYTDCYSVYVNNRKFPKESRLVSYGYNNHWIDHSIEFVSSEFQHIHTNTIERLWRTIKTDLREKKITLGYFKAIGRLYFHKTLIREEQLKFICNKIHNT